MSQRATAYNRAVVMLLSLLLSGPAAEAAGPASRPAVQPGVFLTKVTPHWLDDGHFWYRNDLRNGDREYIYVDAVNARRVPAFDADRLAPALSAATGGSFHARSLSLAIRARDDQSITIATNGNTWRCDLASYQVTRVKVDGSRSSSAPAHNGLAYSSPFREFMGAGQREARSVATPDGRRTAEIRDDGNIYLTSSTDEKAPAAQLSHDGTRDVPYTHLSWSPDGHALVAFRIRRGDHKDVYRLESSPPDRNGWSPGGAGRAIVHADEYTLPGDRLDSYTLNLFDIAATRQMTPAVEPIDCSLWGEHPDPAILWRPDGRHFTYEKWDRGHQRFRLMEIDVDTGTARAVLDEHSDTFIWSAHIPDLHLQLLNYLDNGREVVYVSERSGWRHLYLLDEDSGRLTPMTSGDWCLRGILDIDEQSRQVYFLAGGVYPGQDPYLVHYGRVNFDGTGLTWLTDADGTHDVDFGQPMANFSPGRSYLVVTHSRVDLPPITELRRVADGKLVLTLEHADVGDWRPWLEPFVAKGRDGKTDIYGVICRPADFDPSKKYPILESVYAGPQAAYVPKAFLARQWWTGLTRLGFVVVQVDGMGTAFRSKAFHDVCWKNLADAGFPDRIAWIKAAAAKYPYMDIDHVGIFGTSAGGQTAAGALIFHNDFYQAAVANSGCHDNRLDKISWNEQWMGWPIGPQYTACSNIDNAAKLKGHLQLVLGEMDDNVPVDSTFRLVNNLVQLGKDFDFVFIPNAGHGAMSPITDRKMQDFFVRYLQMKQPAASN